MGQGAVSAKEDWEAVLFRGREGVGAWCRGGRGEFGHVCPVLQPLCRHSWSVQWQQWEKGLTARAIHAYPALHGRPVP
jgi:hypothetical protein